MSKPIKELSSALNLIRDQLTEVIDASDVSGVFDRSDHPDRSTVGAHVRHIVEFFIELDEQISTGVIDYELRSRRLEIEKSPDMARDTLAAVVTRLDSKLLKYGSDHPIAQRETPHISAIGKITLPSSFGRELVFVIGHAIHHLALVKRIVEGCGHDLPNDVGMAVGTALYNRTKFQRPAP